MTFETRSTTGGDLRFIVDGGRPRIDARAIIFDSWSVDLGGFRERMLPGSVELDSDLPAVFDHNSAWVLGRTSANTLEVRNDSIGVAFTAYPPETTWAKDLRVSMERGDIKGCSYRMMVEEDFWYVQDGVVCRDVIKAKVSELTVTSMPAYPETTAEARSHAAALAKQTPTEDRAGRVISGANEQVLIGALNQIELAGDAIAAVIKSVNPSFNEDNIDAETSETEMESGSESDVAIITGGAPADDGNSSDGASETQARSSAFVPGFGFINTPRKR